MKREQLTKVLADLGADDPDSWADSEIEDGIPQLARFLFLKGCWDMVVGDGDTSWIDTLLKNTPEDSSGPYDGTAHALRRLLAAGASRDDIAEVVRCTQAEFMFGLCYLLSDSSSVEGNEYVSWALVEVDENDQPGREINGVHESVLGTDPTGREMRPKER